MSGKQKYIGTTFKYKNLEVNMEQTEVIETIPTNIFIPTESIKEAYQDTVIRLISRHEYYAHILLQLKVSFVDKPNFTLGVTIRQGNVHLIVGTEFFLKSTNDKRVFYLQHEMAHIILGHLAAERSGNPEDHKIMNIAMDTAIHEILTNAKSLFVGEKDIKICTVESIRELTKDNSIKNNETTEYYFNFLKSLKEELKEKFKDFKFDEHEFGEGEGEGEGTPFDIDVAKALTVGLLEKAKSKMGAGTTPGEAEITIEKYRKSKKDWRAILRRYTASMVDSNVKTTRNKRNRRYGFIIPGKKKTFNPKVVAIVDTSGSMDSERISKVWGELYKLEKQGYEITIIEADAAVHRVMEFNSKKCPQLKGGGGTLYQPALDAAAKLNPDICIYMTDLDPADKVTKAKFSVIWMCVVETPPWKPDFGVIINVGGE
jgi:predicted metal-dependent peptidase